MEIVASASGLRWPVGFNGGSDSDCLDWLGAIFGFQRDNVKNQREHLVMLLAKSQARFQPESESSSELEEDAVDAVLNRMLKFYEGWCDRLGKNYCYGQPKSGLTLQRKILYMSLYLLILGEAGNVRFMPDCLCYIFHKMACQISGLLSREKTECIQDWSDEAFIRKVIDPLRRVIEKEARKGENGEMWCDYDDLNEYFRSVDCFSLAWPLRRNNDFFRSTQEAVLGRKSSGRRSWSARKSNSEPKCSFWRVLASFDRSLTFHILALQAMVIAAWSGASSPKEIFRKESLYNISTIFITAAFLRFLQNISELCRNYPGWKLSDLLRNVVKIVVSLGIIVVLSLYYLLSNSSASMKLRELSPLLPSVEDAPSLYISAVGLYCVPNIVAAVLFCFPMLRRWMEDSGWRIFGVLLGRSKRRMYLDRTMHESQFMLRRYFPWKIYSMHESHLTLVGYSLFWAMLLLFKITFSYYVQIKPLVIETKELMGFFPNAEKNFRALISLWQPTILAYYYWQVHFTETQIWFSIFLAACDRIRDRIGENGLQEVTAHLKFVEDYRMFSWSHVKGLELMMLLMFANISGSALSGSTSYVILGLSMWSLAASTLLGPFLLNPLGFEFNKVGSDWDEWTKWMDRPGGILVPATESWESWWDEEQENLKFTGLDARFREIVLSLRYFLYQYGIIHQLNASPGCNTIMFYGLSWLILVAAMVLLKIKSPGFRQMFGYFIWAAFVVATIALYPNLIIGSIFSCLLASVPAGWGLLQILQACRPVVERLGMWSFVKELARGYDRIMGMALFAPVALIARLPFVSGLQTGCYFCPERI